MQFEHFKVYAPKDAEYFLRLKFGDYMELPPVEEQVPKHHYDAYLKSEQEE